MAVLIQAMSLTPGTGKKVLDELRESEAWKAAQEMGLEFMYLYVSPTEPSAGTLMSRWASPEDAEKFQSRFGAAALRAPSAPPHGGSSPATLLSSVSRS